MSSFAPFPTYSLALIALWDDGHGLLGLFNAVGSLVCGLLLVTGGRASGAWLMGL